MEFFLREARHEDSGTLWDIDQKCFPPGISYSRAELTVYMRRWGAFTLVAEPVKSRVKGSTPAGISGIGGFLVAESGNRGVGHIITIDVLPEARRSGVGSKLLSAAEERLLGSQCRRVMLEVAVDNRSALIFYKRHKYTTVKTIPHYYSNGVDALVMQKDLLLHGPNR